MYTGNYLVILIANVRATCFDSMNGVRSSGSGVTTPDPVVQIQGIWNMP